MENNKTQPKKDNAKNTAINLGVILVFFIITYMIYKYFIKGDYDRLRREGFYSLKNNFADTANTANTANTTNTADDKNYEENINKTIYEQSLNNIYGDNKRLMCSILPNINKSSTVCKLDNLPYIIYKYPVHMIKLLDDSILAIFNDGRMYTKITMESTLWKGPVLNSMPNDLIPLRMITLSTDLITLLGVGYDNMLYIKAPKTDTNGVNTDINLSGVWKQVPNNSNIIYVLFDNSTNFLISIDNNGKLFTKTSTDITTINRELITSLDRPILRLYYDLNGYMLAIDNKFNLYQFETLDWKNSKLQIQRGANPNKVQDLLYDNDGKLFGLVFDTKNFSISIMKQNSVFYLSEFYDLDFDLTKNVTPNFLLSNIDILKCKIGSIYDYLNNNTLDDENDDDPNFAFQKQIIETKKKLRKFCVERGSASNTNSYDNYELLGNVESNDDKINKLKNIINNLMAYEPDRLNIQEKYAILEK